MNLELLKEKLEEKGIVGLDIEEKTLSDVFVRSILDKSKITYHTEKFDGDKKVTICNCQLPNGFVLTESSSCVNPEKYDEKLGVESCVKRFEDQIWKLYGFFLQEFDFISK